MAILSRGRREVGRHSRTGNPKIYLNRLRPWVLSHALNLIFGEIILDLPHVFSSFLTSSSSSSSSLLRLFFLSSYPTPVSFFNLHHGGNWPETPQIPQGYVQSTGLDTYFELGLAELSRVFHRCAPKSPGADQKLRRTFYCRPGETEASLRPLRQGAREG